MADSCDSQLPSFQRQGLPIAFCYVICNLNPAPGPSEAFYRLWPPSFASVEGKASLAALVPPLRGALSRAAVAFSSVDGGRWLAPTQALFLDDCSARHAFRVEL